MGLYELLMEQVMLFSVNPAYTVECDICFLWLKFLMRIKCSDYFPHSESVNHLLWILHMVQKNLYLFLKPRTWHFPLSSSLLSFLPLFHYLSFFLQKPTCWNMVQQYSYRHPGSVANPHMVAVVPGESDSFWYPWARHTCNRYIHIHVKHSYTKIIWIN